MDASKEVHKAIHYRIVVIQSMLNVVSVFFDKRGRMYFRKKKKRFFDFILGKGKTEIPTCDRINPELEG